jgi:quinol monooxygenase YgiN
MEERMPDSNILLVARFRAKAGKEEEVGNILVSLVEPTRAEEGCVFYYLHQVKEEKGHFLFYECFRNEEAFNIHVETPYIKGFLDRKDELLAEPPDITFLEKIQ